MAHKKVVHGLGCAWALRISEATTAISSRPGMSHAVNYPVFLHLVAIAVVPGAHGIGTTTWHLPICGTCWTIKAGIVCVIGSKMIGLHPLLHDLISVERIDQVVACAMK